MFSFSERLAIEKSYKRWVTVSKRESMDSIKLFLYYLIIHGIIDEDLAKQKAKEWRHLIEEDTNDT